MEKEKIEWAIDMLKIIKAGNIQSIKEEYLSELPEIVLPILEQYLSVKLPEAFEDFLRDEHSKGYQGTDDNMPDAYEEWLTVLDYEKYIEYGNKYFHLCKLSMVKAVPEVETILNFISNSDANVIGDKFSYVCGTEYIKDLATALHQMFLERIGINEN